jgi:hypothetical protein
MTSGDVCFKRLLIEERLVTAVALEFLALHVFLHMVVHCALKLSSLAALGANEVEDASLFVFYGVIFNV